MWPLALSEQFTLHEAHVMLTIANLIRVTEECSEGLEVIYSSFWNRHLPKTCIQRKIIHQVHEMQFCNLYKMALRWSDKSETSNGISQTKFIMFESAK